MPEYLSKAKTIQRVKQQMSLIFLYKADGLEQCYLCGFSARTVEVDSKTICSVMQVREEHFTRLHWATVMGAAYRLSVGC